MDMLVCRERRLAQLYEEKKELQTRCCNQEIELQRLKSVSKERIIRDEAQIKQLAGQELHFLSSDCCVRSAT